MLQQRKKDYFQRIIEEFFAQLFKLLDVNKQEDLASKKHLLDECFQFFSDNFEIKDTDTAELIAFKINDLQLTEQYAKLMLIEKQLISDNSDKLHKALELVEYIEKNDTTYSWDRIALREDILRYLDTQN